MIHVAHIARQSCKIVRFILGVKFENPRNSGDRGVTGQGGGEMTRIGSGTAEG